MNSQFRKPAFFSLILLMLFFLSCSSETAPSSVSDPEKVMDAIKEFYSSYILESSKMPPNDLQIEALKNRHCTQRFLTQLNDAEVDVDPFLNAQDVDEKWASTLEIIPKDVSKNLYSVCYEIGYDKSKQCVVVLAKENQGLWKIDNVEIGRKYP